MLDVRPFIKDHIDPIYSKLEECEEDAKRAPVNSDMMFLALALPVINGVIHIASNPTALRDAMDWVTSKWAEPKREPPDAVSILSALTLIYIVYTGYMRYKQDEDHEKKEKWLSIWTRAKKLAEGLEE